jgi:hypothetical protein
MLASFGGAIGQLLLMLAWGLLLVTVTRSPVGWQPLLSVYGRSNIAKYLPSNALHFAGRQMLGRRFGWGQAGMATATLLELAIVVAMALAFVLALGSIAAPPRLGMLAPTPWIAASLGLLVAGICGFLLFAPRIPILSGWLGALHLADALRASPAMLGALGCYAGFFALSGALLWLIFAGVAGVWNGTEALTVCMAFSAAWLAGYVTPGAPGGVGVREAMLLLLLKDVHGEPVALAAALAMRIATTLGDFLVFGLAVAVDRISGPSQSMAAPHQ